MAETVEQRMLWNARARARRHGVPFDIGLGDIVVPEVCPVLGIQLERSVGGAAPNSPSLDRVIPENGYVKGNVRVISHRANAIKSNATAEEIIAVAEYVFRARASIKRRDEWKSTSTSGSTRRGRKRSETSTASEPPST